MYFWIDSHKNQSLTHLQFKSSAMSSFCMSQHLDGIWKYAINDTNGSVSLYDTCILTCFIIHESPLQQGQVNTYFIGFLRVSSPKNEISVINYSPSYRFTSARPSFIFGTQIKIFLMKSKRFFFLSPIESNIITTFKDQKISKDLNSQHDYSGSTLMLWSDENTFCVQKQNYHNHRLFLSVLGLHFP